MGNGNADGLLDAFPCWSAWIFSRFRSIQKCGIIKIQGRFSLASDETSPDHT